MKSTLEKLGWGDYFSKSHLQPRSILESFHPLAIFGQICGFLPIKNVLVGLTYSLENSAFQLFSYPVLYSIVLNLIIYAVSFETTLGYWAERQNIFIFSTDAFAIQTFLAVYLFLRFTLHLLCIYRAPKVLECLKNLEDYDKFYKLENRTNLINKYLAFYLVGTTINIIGNVSATYPEVLRTIRNNNRWSTLKNDASLTNMYLISHVIPSAEVLSVLAYGIHIIAEAGLFFSHCCITFIITGVCDRVSAITTEIKDIAKSDNCSFLREPLFHGKGHDKQNDYSSDQVALWIKQMHPLPLFTPVNSKMSPYSRHYSVDNGQHDKFGFLKCHQDGSYEEQTVKKLKTLCSKYMSLLYINRLLNSFTKETVTVFTAGSAVMLVALCYLICILLTQYVPVKMSRIKESVEIIPIIFVAAITFLRLLNFINTGEKMRNDVCKK